MASNEPRLPTRYDVEWAAERAPLPTIAKDVLYALARRMEQGTTTIPPQGIVSLTKLAKACGWSRRHLMRALNFLELLDIIVRRRPSIHDARTRHARTTYIINVYRLAELGSTDLQIARDAVAHGLGPRSRKAKDTGTHELGTARPQARDGVAHESEQPEQPEHTDREIDAIITLLKGRTGKTVSAEWAAQTRDLILARPASHGQPRMARIRRVLLMDKHPEKWLPTPQPPKFTRKEHEHDPHDV